MSVEDLSRHREEQMGRLRGQDCLRLVAYQGREVGKGS